MNALHFDEANNKFVAPKGMEDTIFDLHVWRGDDSEGVPNIISCWEPTDEEIQEIIETRKVWLFIQGVSMPPVSVSGRYPFTNVRENPDYEETKNAES